MNVPPPDQPSPARPGDPAGEAAFAPSGVWSSLTATSAGGLIAATVGAEGRVHRLTVDPRMTQYGLDVVCEQIVEAINQGLNAVHGRAAAAASTGVRQSDPVLLAARLDEVRAESGRRSAALEAALGEIVDQLRRSRQ